MSQIIEQHRDQGAKVTKTFFPAEGVKEDIRWYELQNDQHTSVVHFILVHTHLWTNRSTHFWSIKKSFETQEVHIINDKNRSVCVRTIWQHNTYTHWW